jgi:hypothetical protein
MIRRTLLFKFVSWFVLSPVLAAALTHQTHDIPPRNELTGLYAIRESPMPQRRDGRVLQVAP